MPPWRWRFSLRFLLLTTALAPAAAYWFALPTLNARRYAAAIEAGEHQRADDLCIDPQRRFPGTWTRHRMFRAGAHLSTLTWRDFRRGERRLHVAIDYSDGGGLAGCSVECVATRRGIKVGKFLP